MKQQNKSYYPDPEFSNECFYGFMNALNEYIMIIDLNGIIRFANESACRYYSSTQEAIKGSSIYNILSDMEKDHFIALLNTRASQCFEQKIYGNVFIYNYFPITDRSNHIIKIIIYIRDISKIRNMENQLIRVSEIKNSDENYVSIDHLKQHLTAMNYMLFLLKKKLITYRLPEQSLVLQLKKLCRDAIRILKKLN